MECFATYMDLGNQSAGCKYITCVWLCWLFRKLARNSPRFLSIRVEPQNQWPEWDFIWEVRRSSSSTSSSNGSNYGNFRSLNAHTTWTVVMNMHRPVSHSPLAIQYHHFHSVFDTEQVSVWVENVFLLYAYHWREGERERVNTIRSSMYSSRRSMAARRRRLFLVYFAICVWD